MESTLKRTWAEIDLDALAHNYQVLRERMGPGSRFMGVVKADAYGHGAAQVARTLEELGAEYLAVSNLDEARELRHAGVTRPILQLGVTPAEQTPLALVNQITQAVWSEEAALAFSQEAVKAGGRLRVHVKLDPGMSRLGFPCDEERFRESLEAVCRVCALPGLEAEGIFTHFAVSDELDADSRAYTVLQRQRFEDMVRELARRGCVFPIRHCSNSGAVALYPEYADGMCRPGLVTYGVGEQAQALGLRPVMTLKAVVGAVNRFGPDVSVSYGRTFHTQRPSRLGVLPIGYADGFHRSLSNCWHVWTPYGPAPIVGRICMDMCMIDLTDLPQIREGDEVEVYGPHNSVSAAAAAAGTIPYELTCAVNKRVPRIYRRHGQEIARELLLRG